MRRQARLFAITEYLRARRTGVTAQVLADRFGVTLRTIYRDLDLLRSADLPLHAEQGRGGGYALDRHYTLPPINLSAREAAVLVAIGAHAIQMRLVPFPESLGRALDKVRGALSVSAQRELLTLLGELKFVGVPAAAGLPGVRRAVEEAWFAQRILEVRYRSAQGELSTRRVRISGVVMERTVTLLNCVDVDTAEKRQLRLDRLEHAATND
jgi:predicted DNA-binding transcriptional regulator YafY